MLEGGPLTEDDFVEFTKDYVLFCHITTQVETDKYQRLLSQKGGRGFPYLIMMDPDGSVLTPYQTGYTVSMMNQAAAEANELHAKIRELAKQSAAGNAGAKSELFFLHLELKRYTFSEANAAKDGLTLTGDQQKKMVSGLAKLEASEIWAEAQDPVVAGKQFLAMEKAGRIPTDDDDSVQMFWVMIMRYSEDQKDPATFKRALGVLRKKYGDSPGSNQFFEREGETLRRLEGS